MPLPSDSYLGDSIRWRENLPPGATGRGVLRHVESGLSITIEPTISGSEWTLDVAPGRTGGMPSGTYSASVVIEQGGERETRLIGSIILREPVDRPAEMSHARKMVGLLERHLEGRIDDGEGRGLESYTIGGVPITKLSSMDARRMLELYRQDLKREETQARAEAGLGTGRRILPTFES